MEHWWNETGTKNKAFREKPATVHHKSHTDWPGIEPGPLWGHTEN